MIVRVLVGFTTSRPIVPDEHFAAVIVHVDCPRHEDIPRAECEAELLAIAIVCADTSVEMPTSSAIEAVLEV